MPGWRPVYHACRQYSVQASSPRAVRGMADRFGPAMHKHQHIISRARAAAEACGYEPIHTPVLEYSSLFERTLGADSDVVGKELYKFQDSGGEWMTMRPEGTAPVARALVSNGLEKTLPQRLYYSGPMFRHERPQKGRLRQFEQFGIENIGAAHPAVDVECIQMGWGFLSSLGLSGKMSLQLNTLGDRKSRTDYRNALYKYFSQHKLALSENSRRRLDTNPMRILDSKDSGDIQLAADAPAYDAHLTLESRTRFDFVQRALGDLGIPYTLNAKLVRGLDYYQHTVWEVVCASDRLGRSQATVLAGGRYDGLTAAVGGTRSLPGIGWATGIDRLALLIPDEQVPQQPLAIPVLMIPGRSDSCARAVHDDVYIYAMRVASVIRRTSPAYVLHGTSSEGGELGAHPALGKQLTSVMSKPQVPSQVVIVGDSEMAQNQVILRDTATRTQRAVDIGNIAHALLQSH